MIVSADARPALPQPGGWRCEAARIEQIRQETSDVSTYEFAWRDGAKEEGRSFAPGQFHMVYLPGYGEAALSISSNPAKSETFAHTVRRLGNVTHALARLSVGDSVGIRGPFGTPWPLDRFAGHDIVIASGGLGLAPLRPVIYELVSNRDRYGRVAIAYGARTPNDLLFADEFQSWRDNDLEVAVTVDMDALGWDGPVGVVPGLIDTLDADFETAAVFICGPEIMMRYTVQEAFQRSAKSQNIFLAMERNMSCGMGLCGRCQIGPVLLCRDGPVVCYETIAPFLNLEDL
ncbi:MAG: FAD/NAD(P)-binding protein [Planctomycetota bacterium]